MTQRYDKDTIEFYDREAVVYTQRARRDNLTFLNNFIARFARGVRILELGAGDGADAEAMIAAGLDVDATDASAGLAAIASERIGRPVRLMRFDELEAVDAYDGVWASACLHHAPDDELIDALRRIHASLKPGGVLFASVKSGRGPDRDQLGRYYNFPSRRRLEDSFAASGPWASLEIAETLGGGYDGVARVWLNCLARKPA